MAEQMMQETAGKAIPAGYKQTEVGVIPEDWDVCLLKNICSSFKTGKLDANAMILDGEYRFYTCARNYYWINQYAFDDEALLISGNGANVGYIHYYKGKFNAYQRTYVLTCFSADIQFLKKQMEVNLSERIRTEVNAGNTPYITMDTLTDMMVPLPKNRQEQTAIANVLSDSDALIDALEQLIAKKQAVKSATMQQLLTGRTRLPAFALRPDGTKKGYKPSELGDIPEDWEVVNFSSAVWFQEGPGVRQYQFTYSGVKLLNGTNIDKGMLLLDKTQRFISEKLAYGQYSHFMIDEGDILIACSGVTIERFEEKVTISKREDLPLCLNTSTMRFKVRSENIDKNYIKDFLKSSFFKDQIVGKATGSAQLNFGPYHVNQVKIALSVKAEQTAIATILSDMDNELQALTQKLEKARALKQGMMQQLLTGKIRLPLAVGA